ncbi:MAG: hypothetical protein AAB426_00240 [Myxococcota bacterium]
MRWMLLATVLASPTLVGAQELPDFLMDPDPIFRDAPTPYVAPGRSFSLNLPGGWQAAAKPGDPATIELRTVRRNQEGILQIHHMQVPQGALPRQLLLNALDLRLGKLPGFRELARRDVKISGVPASVLTAAYSFQGNIQYPRSLEEIYVVSGTDGYVFHFECFAPVTAAFASDLNAIYSSFVVRPAMAAESATPPPAIGAEPEAEPLPEPGL